MLADSLTSVVVWGEQPLDMKQMQAQGEWVLIHFFDWYVCIDRHFPPRSSCTCLP